MNKIECSCQSQKEKEEHYSGLNSEDKHWNWILKAKYFIGEEYEWFYLLIDNAVQAIAVIKFPVDAILEPGKIFYIDYIAVSPWNRNLSLHKKMYKGLGKLLVRYILDYALRMLSLRLGCSLHSLPQAESFYARIGMDKLSKAHLKDGLQGFEFRKKKAEAFMEEE